MRGISPWARCIPRAVSCVIRRVRPTNRKYTKPAVWIKKVVSYRYDFLVEAWALKPNTAIVV